MFDEEMKAEMAKYTEALNQKEKCFENWNQDDDKNDEIIEERLRNAKETAHRIAIECLNKILTPELKVFIKNLSLDRLNYPDEPVFYKLFGEYPKEGDKIPSEKLKEIGITSCELDDLNCIWMNEGCCGVFEDLIDGKMQCRIEWFNETDEDVSKEQREWLKNTYRLKRELTHNDTIDAKTKETISDLLNQVSPLIGKLKL